MFELKERYGTESITLYNKNDVVEAIGYALYYTANPDSKMCVPNVAYIKAEAMLKKWEKEKDDSNKGKRKC